MKRGTTKHPKFKRLQQMLGVPEYHAIGVLEGVWMIVEEFLDDGAIGRWSDSNIAASIGWNLDARQLVMALIECEWLDEVDGPDRLVIHDWLSHCSGHCWDRVRKRVERAAKNESADPLPEWLVQMHEKAKRERSKNQDDKGDRKPQAEEKPPRPDTSAVNRNRPATSGNVRDGPAASGLSDPLPKTQDPRPKTGGRAAPAFRPPGNVSISNRSEIAAAIVGSTGRKAS